MKQTHDIEVANADGVIIYYNYINDKTELEVTYKESSSDNSYSGHVVIPGSVTYEGMTFPVTAIGEEAFHSCHNLIIVTIPDSVKSIDDSAFSDCYSLAEAIIGDCVTEIGWETFCNCWNLTKVTIGNSVTSIGYWAFRECKKLINLTIPDCVTSIVYGAFSGCKKLTELTIPDSVTSIDEYAFYECYDLEKVTIGSSIAEIGNHAFGHCENLTTLYSLNTIPPEISDVFDEYHYEAINVYVPQEALAAYQKTYDWVFFAEKLQAYCRNNISNK